MNVFAVCEIERVVAFVQWYKFPVFPCRAREETLAVAPGRTRLFKAKSPLVHNGFHAATKDEAQIRAWWRDWPDALVGVPTGSTTGLVVLDYDPAKASKSTTDWLEQHTNLLVLTRAHKTARDGLHYLYTAPASDRYQTGTDLFLDGHQRKGLDLRAAGGYVIWWPLHGGEVVGDTIAPLPAGLIDERRFDAARDLAPLPKASPRTWRKEEPRLIEALRHLKPEGYEGWIRIGMALHHASDGSEAGFALWHDWSAKGDSYDGIDDCRYHWASFGRYAGRSLITVSSVFSAAKEAGYEVPPATRPETPPIEAYAGDRELAASKPAATDPATTTSSLIKATWAKEYATLSATKFLVGNLIESGSLVLVFGESNTGKSTFAIDLAVTCCRGTPWRGRRTHKTVACYLPLEGTRGVRQRVRAKILHDDIPEELAFADLTGRIDLLNEVSLIALIAALREIHTSHPQTELLLVIDTVSRAMAGGDENSSQDMGALIGACDVLRTELACTIMLIHHSGKDSTKGARGHSSLRAAVDTEIEVTGTVNPRVVTVRKQRDLPSGDTFAFDLEPVDLGTDPETYDSISACVALYRGEVPEPEPQTVKGPTGKAQRQLLAGLRNQQKDAGHRIFWTLEEMRAVGRSGGLTKGTSYKAVESLALSGFLVATVGGYGLPVES